MHVGSSVPAPTTDTLTLLLPERTMRLLRAHTWPGNLRQIAMTVENALVFAMSEMLLVRGGERADIIQIRPKLVRDLLDNLDLGVESTRADSIVVSIEPEASLNKVAVSCEKQYFVQLYIRERGDFGAMARQLLGDEAHARKVQLRFNQLGLRVRELREKLV